MKCPYRKKKTAKYYTEYDDDGNVAINNLEEEIEEFEDCLGTECPMYEEHITVLDYNKETVVTTICKKKNFFDSIIGLISESDDRYRSYVTDLINNEFITEVKDSDQPVDYHKILMWLSLYGARFENFRKELLDYFYRHYDVTVKEDN